MSHRTKCRITFNVYCIILGVFMSYVAIIKDVAISSFLFYLIGVYIGNDFVDRAENNHDLIMAMTLPALLVLCAIM